MLTDGASDATGTYGSDGSTIDLRSVSMSAAGSTLSVSIKVTDLEALGTQRLGTADYYVFWTVDDAKYAAHAHRTRDTWRFGVYRDYPVRTGEVLVPGEADMNADTLRINAPYSMIGIAPATTQLQRVTANTAEYVPWGPNEGPMVPVLNATGQDEANGPGGQGGKYTLGAC